MLIDIEEWLVRVDAYSRDRNDATSVRQVLEQSDLGGDIVHLADGPLAISLTVAAPAQSEQRAYHRVIARVSDTLGSRWTVRASPSSPPAPVTALSER
jgi:hypothetical protein